MSFEGLRWHVSDRGRRGSRGSRGPGCNGGSCGGRGSGFRCLVRRRRGRHRSIDPLDALKDVGDGLVNLKVPCCLSKIAQNCLPFQLIPFQIDSTHNTSYISHSASIHLDIFSLDHWPPPLVPSQGGSLRHSAEPPPARFAAG